MKSIFKILILAAVPILAVTAVADQGLAADKGSQLIFQSNMAHQSYISVTNANNGRAVTVLVQYYNDEMARVLWYLRVIPGGGNVLVDPFDHEIPGTAEKDDDDMEISGTAANVSDVIGALPARTNDDDGAGMNSGRFVIAVTAVGANIGLDLNEDGKIADPVSVTEPAPGQTLKYAYRIVDSDDEGDELQNEEITIVEYLLTAVEDATAEEQRPTASGGAIVPGMGEMNRASTVNVLFPAFLAADMHGVDNIDDGGTLSLIGTGLGITNKAKNLIDQDDGTSVDESTKNVGDLNVGNAVPIAFNHLTGNFTEALTSTASGGADQTASWGGTPIVRPTVSDTANEMKTYSSNVAGRLLDDRMVYMMGDYHALNGMNSAPVVNSTDIETDGAWLSLDDYNAIAGLTPLGTGDPAPVDGDATPATNFDNAMVRGITGGRLAEKDAGGGEVVNVVTAGSGMNRGLNGGALVLPALYGGSAEQTHQVMLFLSAADHFGGAGGYSLMAAKTKYTVTVHDNMGNILSDPADDRVFGGAGGSEIAGLGIIVEGIGVMTDAGKCGGEMTDGAWTLADLTGLVPAASSGTGKFAGLDATLDPAKNASPGFIKFMRAGLECTKDFGDGDSADGDATPAVDKRTYKGGTLIVEKASTDRAFVTTGQALLKFLTPNATFAASWSLKSPPGPAN